jgi:hypothetical protein
MIGKGLPGLKKLLFFGRFAGTTNRSYKSAICNKRAIGAAAKTAPKNHLEPPLQISPVVVYIITIYVDEDRSGLNNMRG